MACTNNNNGYRFPGNRGNRNGNQNFRNGNGNEYNRRGRANSAAEAAAIAATAARNDSREDALLARSRGNAEQLSNCTSPITGTLAEEFYGASRIPRQMFTTCCDAFNGCQEYDIRTRCPFWPAFAHPRWLSCDELYSCPPRYR